MYEIADKAVAKFLRRNPSLNYLRDELYSAACVAIAERPGADEKQLWNAVNNSIKETVTQDIQWMTRSQHRTLGEDRSVVDLQGDVIEARSDVLDELLESCSSNLEEAVVRMLWGGASVKTVAEALDITVADVRAASDRVMVRYSE